MADEPSFPSPDEARRRESGYRVPASSAMAPPNPPAIVQRAKPLADDPTHSLPVKLTPEEIQAILAVEGAGRPSRGKTLWRRGRVILIPTALLSTIAELFLGEAASWIVCVAGLLAIAWTLKPLLKRDGWD